uniref:PH domain-containing protein n=1 Tax=Laticauda laticaudata TaxID=8630 RepID=A0A8C5SRS7_LATLA
MSGSTARKVQPFTISTKLSLPKYSLEFPRDSCPDIPLQALNNHDLHQNLSECVSLYLAQTSLEPAGEGLKSASPVEEEVTNDDCINSNSLSRSIKKITLSNWHGKDGLGEEGIFGGPSHTSAEKNYNNNNCKAGKAQFKVFLRKEVEPREEKQNARSPQAGDNTLVSRVVPFMTASSVAAPPWKESTKITKPGKVVVLKPGIESSSPGVADLSKWSLLLAQFNCDMVQAEKWMRGKLLDLKDGCRFQEWERIAQILQREMKDFENTIIKLNQMGEQLMIQPKSSTEIERRLQTLQEQWQLLKHMATNQTKTVIGFKSLQEFNQKAEQLETWIRQKEEKPLLAILLQEKADKVQITRQILDLKQEELQFQAVHEELNSLAQKLEKQGKSESRSIMARRKYLNKMWLQLQRTLKEHHETLQQALEAASFLQQADVLLSVIHAKLRHFYGERKQNEFESSLDMDIRDIASQVMMLDVTMSQLISLHPSLAAQVSLKHQDIKENWARLQQLSRSDNPPQLALTKEFIDSSPNQVLTITTKSPEEDPEEKLVWEVQKNAPEITVQGVRSQENNSDFLGREAINGDSRRRRKFLRQPKSLKDLPQQEAHLQDICQDTDREIQQLPSTDHRWSPEMEDALEELGELWTELKKRHQENGKALQEIDTALQLVGELEAAECWLETVAGLLSEPRATKNLDDLQRDLQKVGTLKNKAGAWAAKIHTLQEEMQMVASSEHTAAAMIQRKMKRVKEKLVCVQEALQRQASDLHDSLILMEFLQNVQMDQTLNQKSQIKGAPNQFSSPESLQFVLVQSAQQGNSKDMSRPLKELQEAVEMLNNVVKEREQALKAATQTKSPECFPQVMKDKEEIGLSWVTSQIETIRERSETLAQDLIQAERSFITVKSEMDLLDVQGMQKRQEEIESDMSQLEGNIEELERAVTHLVQVSDDSKRTLEIVEAWKDLQKLVLENSIHGQQTVRLWQFFKSYLAIISWTEDTRTQIFSENLNAQGLSEAPWENLKNSMEAKFKEFEELAASGWELVTEEHYLSKTIKERMEELQNMLGWMMVRYQAQCSPKDPGNKNDERETQNSTLNMPQNLQNELDPRADVTETDGILNSKVLMKCSTGDYHQQQNEPVSTAFPLNVPPGCKQGLEESGTDLPSEVDVPKGILVLEPSETPVLLMPQAPPGSLGSTVSLILNIEKEGEIKARGSQAASSPTVEQETLHKVSTYLHVKEKDRCGNQDPDFGNSDFISESVKQVPPRVPSSPFSRIEWSKAASHTFPKISSSCSSKSPKGKTKGMAGDIQRLTLQRIMGKKANYLQEVKYSMSNTWPPRCTQRVQVLQALSLPQRELMDPVKNPLDWANDADCDLPRETSGKCIFLKQNTSLHSHHASTEKINTCQHLSLGSVLSLELPKDLSALRNVHDIVRVARDEVAERKGGNQVNQVTQRSTEEAKTHETSISLEKETIRGQQVMHSKPVRAEDVSHKVPKTKKGTWFEEVNLNPSYSRQKTYSVACSEEVRLHPKSQNNSSDECFDFKQNKPPHTSVFHEQIDLEWEKLAASPGRMGISKEKQVKDADDKRAKVQEALKLKLKPFSAESTSNPDLVSHLTEMKDPLVNETSEKENTQCSEESISRHPSTFLHLGHKSPTKPSKLDCELGYEENTQNNPKLCPFNLTPRAEVPKGTKLQGMAAEVRHPAHEMFEEEEEELQAIWNNMERRQKGSDVPDDPGRKVDKEQSLGSSSGKLLLTSADNWLIAKFKFPTSAEMLQNSEGGRRASLGVDKRKNRPNQCSKADISSCQELNKEVASSPGELSLQKIYPVDQQKFQEESKSVSKIHPSKLELQMMEGPLERKNLLQAGGRKANSRSWNTFHTVLMRQTLCFYQDKKDTLKSSVMAIPLNLSGAVCTLETEYTKKSNCFTLQLNDGSKYLLRAPTEPLMKEWVTKLQQNSGLPEVDFFPSSSQPAQGMTSVASAIPGQGVSHFQSFQKKLPAKSQEIRFLPKSSVKLHLPYSTHSEPLETTGNGLRAAPIYTTEQNLKQRSPLESANSQEPQFYQEDDWELVTSKRRSYSFTSATYQKITPLSKSKEPNNYSVTLYIGEQAPTTPPRPRCHSFIASPGGAREIVGEHNQSASPIQKNKSVFRKFFGKKD